MEIYRAKNVATYITFPIVDADGDTVTGATALDSEIDAWSDGAAPDGFTDCTNEATEIGTTGIYYLSITQAEMNNDYIVIQVKTTSSGAKTQIILINTKPITANVTQVAGTTQTANDMSADCNTIVSELANGTYGLSAIETLVDELESRLGTPSNLGSGANLSANLVDIEAQTDDIGAAGAGLTSIPNSAGVTTLLSRVPDTISLANINAQVDTAIADARLDELLAADSDIDGLTPPTVGSVFHELMTKTAGSFTYDQTTDSLEAIRDRGDAAWITATGFSTHSAADVWAVATRALTDKADFTISAANRATLVDEIWDEDVDTSHQTAGTAGKKLDDAGGAADPWSTALPGAYGAGTAGNILGNRLVGTIATGTHNPQSGDAYAIVNHVTYGNSAIETLVDDLESRCTEIRLAELDAANLPTDIANVQADTDNIQTRLPAALVGGKMDASVGAYASGQSPADLVLITPANKLYTDASGYVLEVNVDGVKKNTALNNFEFLMVDATDGYTEETGLTVTAQRSIDGGAFGACANAVVEVSNGIYKINLAAADLNGNVITLRFSATGARTRLITIKTNE